MGCNTIKYVLNLFPDMIEDINNSDELLEVSSELSWQDFEKMVYEIVKEYGYSVEINKVETSPNKRAQFDVLAFKGNQLISIDCKHWDKNRHKKAAIIRAVDEHIKRCEYLAEKRCLDVLPVLVTLYDEDIGFHKNVPVVSLQQLNSFLLDLHSLDNVKVIRPKQTKLG
jgi:hypothetical protein